MNERDRTFLEELEKSLTEKTFVKLTLGNYKGSEPHLQRLLIREIETRKGRRLFFQFKFETRDIVKNYAIDEGVSIVADNLVNGFRSAHLFTTGSDFQLEIGKRNSRLNRGKPTFRSRPAPTHDRQKQELVDKGSYYLRLLDITTDAGEVRSRSWDKWKQINKFVEILKSLYERSGLEEKETLKIADMGCGKGYLTFAAYDFFKHSVGRDVTVVGVDMRSEQIDLCNEVARSGGYEGLEFVSGSITDFAAAGTDILIALHACDTATDEALFKGIEAGAEIIMTAPCCHREIRRQMRSPEILTEVLKHNVLQERTAESITDGLRSMLLEEQGYSTKMLEFVPTEHTPKNNMITALRTPEKLNSEAMRSSIVSVKSFFGITTQRLDELLNKNKEESADASSLAGSNFT
jgi:SAM-dependent methyltransferase